MHVYIDHEVDNTTPGSYTVTYTATDEAGNIATEYLTIVIYDPDFELVLTEYYATATGLNGEALLLELRSIIQTGFTPVSYGDARYILDETDQDPDNPNNLIVVYLGLSVPKEWDDGKTWNREHVWPQSLLGVTTYNTSKHVGADLHNLKPANPNENSSRGNRYFDLTTGGGSYAPRPEVRGDVARILFYMIVMYDYLSLINTVPTTYQMAMLDVLIQWHYEDPVDAFEINRNNVIFSYQQNRNPFIDFPEFVGMIDFTVNMNE